MARRTLQQHSRLHFRSQCSYNSLRCNFLTGATHVLVEHEGIWTMTCITFHWAFTGICHDYLRFSAYYVYSSIFLASTPQFLEPHQFGDCSRLDVLQFFHFSALALRYCLHLFRLHKRLQSGTFLFEGILVF